MAKGRIFSGGGVGRNSSRTSSLGAGRRGGARKTSGKVITTTVNKGSNRAGGHLQAKMPYAQKVHPFVTAQAVAATGVGFKGIPSGLKTRKGG
jgi:hypothetical protein